MNKATIGRGTKVFVAPCLERIWPEEATLALTAGAEVGATSMAITITPPITRPIPASVTRPLFFNFVENSGKSHLITVTQTINPSNNNNASALTVLALKEAIAQNATAVTPLSLANRESANLSDDKTIVDLMTFDNDGYRDQMTTMLAKGLTLPGFFSQRDAGWQTCFQAANDLDYDEIYVRIVFPKPKAPGYTKGMVFEFFSGVTMPFDVPATDIIRTEITLASRGKIRYSPAE